MKKILVVLIAVISFAESRAQNDAYEIFKDDTLGSKYIFDFRITSAQLQNVSRITFYKYVTGQDEPYFIKEVYVSPLDNYYVINDNRDIFLIQNYFRTLFEIYKDEYSQITRLKYSIFDKTGESKSFIINKPN